MKKKATMLLCIVLVAALAFTACSTDNNSATTPEPTKATKTNEPTGSDEQVTLKFLGFKQGGEIGNLNELIAGFEADHPNIKVEYEGINTANGYTTVMNTRLTSGADVDVFMIYGSIPDLIEGGYLQDLTDTSYAQKLSDGLKPFVSEDGRMYACFSNSAAMALFSNKDMLNKYNIEVPTNWEEFLAACELLKSKGETPMVMGNKTGWSPLVISYCMTNSRLTNAGELLKAEEAVLNGEMKCGDMFLDSFKELAVLRDKGYFDQKRAQGMQWNEETFAAFANGEAAFMIGGSWQVAQIKGLEGNNLNFTLTAFPGQKEGELNGTLLPAIPMAVNAKGKHVEEAMMFMDYFFQDANAKAWSESQSAMNPLNGVAVKLDEEMQPFIDTVAAGNSTPYELKVIADFEMQQTIKAMAQAVLSGAKTPEEAAQGVTDFFEQQKLLG